MNLNEFLEIVVTTKTGNFAICLRDNNGWYNEWYNYPDELDKILETAKSKKSAFDVYFTTYLFSDTRRIKESALRTRTIAADLDNADVTKLPVQPTVLVKTSANRHQAYWILKKEIELESHEILSRKLTYSIISADHSGWCIGHVMRLPETLNHKYIVGDQPVEIIEYTGKTYDPVDLELLPDKTKLSADLDIEFLNSERVKFDIGPNQLLETVKSKIPNAVYMQYNTVAKDRSVALWALMITLFRDAGCNREQVFYLAKNSANNKFAGLRYHGDLELAKDVLRAEQASDNLNSNIKERVMQARKLPGIVQERRVYISNIVKDALQREGEFFHTNTDQLYYIRRDVGRPIVITKHSIQLDVMLDFMFGLNPIEEEQSYVISNLITLASQTPINVEMGLLSHYDRDNNIILLHPGKKNVIEVSKNSIKPTNNGAYGVLFPWNPITEGFTPDFNTELPMPWYEFLFGPSMDNIVDLEKDQAMALLRVWTLFLFFKNTAISRPILSFFGSPGCISGETLLDIRRGCHVRTYKIKDLFNPGNIGRPLNLNTINQILSLDSDGKIKFKNISKVVYSGKKETYIVKISNCDSFRTTVDHRFLTPTGYKQLQQLSVGDSVYTKGPNIVSFGRPKVTRKTVTAKYHPFGRDKMVGKFGPYRNILYCRAVLEANINHMSIKDYLYVLNNNEQLSSYFDYLSPDVHIHHQDKNPENNSLSNLQAMSKLEHDKLEGFFNVKNFKNFSGQYYKWIEKVESVEYYGVEDTYDIQMEDGAAPNFLINDVVVHNSGKSTLFRKLYVMLYGRSRGIDTVTSPDNFDQATSTEPLVVLDNVDTWEKWLPDRLAVSISNSDIKRRQLYSDLDTIIVRRQAMIGITAHNPKFGREDIADRMIIIAFERLAHFEPEGDIINEVYKHRNALWGAIVKDLQKVLAVSGEFDENTPQFRVEDFARIGYRIAKGLEIQESFISAIKAISRKQRSFSLEEENTLVITLESVVRKDGDKEIWRSPTVLWNDLETACADPKSFRLIYGTPTKLAKKVWVMSEALSELFDLEYRKSPLTGSKEWKFKLKA